MHLDGFRQLMVVYSYSLFLFFYIRLSIVVFLCSRFSFLPLIVILPLYLPINYYIFYYSHIIIVYFRGL